MKKNMKSSLNEQKSNLVLMEFKNEKNSDSESELDFDKIDINFDAINEISGRDYSIEKEFIQIFINEFVEKIDALKVALYESQFNIIKFLSHSMKSSFSIVGLDIFKNKFQEIENSIENNNCDFKKLQKFKNFVNCLDVNFYKIGNMFLKRYNDINLKNN